MGTSTISLETMQKSSLCLSLVLTWTLSPVAHTEDTLPAVSMFEISTVQTPRVGVASIQLPGQSNPVPIVAGQVVARFMPGTTTDQIDGLFAKYHFSIQRRRPRTGTLLLESSGGASVFDIIVALRNESIVEFAEPNYLLVPAQQSVIPSEEPYFLTQQWPLYNIGQAQMLPDADIDATEAWVLQTGSSNVLVAVADTAIMLDHRDLRENIYISSQEANGVPNRDDDGNGYVDDVNGFNFVDDTAIFSFGYDPVGDPDIHGTFVASIAGASADNSYGMVGTAWSLKILSLEVLKRVGRDSNGSPIMTGDSFSLADAIDYATTRGAHIINMSIEFPNSIEASNALDNAYFNGVLLIAAAGVLSSSECDI